MSVQRILWLRPTTGDYVSVRRERIAEQLRQMGFEVDIQDVSGIDALGAVKRVLLGEYDVIAGNVRMGLYLGYPLSRLVGTPFVGTVSDPLSDIEHLPGPIFRFISWYEWQVLSRADGCTFTYTSSFEEAQRRGIESARRLPNAVDFEAFATPDHTTIEEVERILTKQGVDVSNPIAIYIGRFTRGYHLTDILEAAEKTPEWQFLFVGEGQLAGEVKAAARALENVFYPGAFEYTLMPGFLRFASVGFCFKDAEQPLKLKEYGAAGLTVFAHPGTLESFYTDEELMFVHPSSCSIARGLSGLTSDDCMRYAETLQQRVSKSSWESIAQGFASLLDDVIT